MASKYKIFLSSIATYVVLMFVVTSIPQGNLWGISKFLDHVGVIKVSSTFCTQSLNGSCTTNMTPALAVWPHISMLISLFGFSYLVDKYKSGFFHISYIIGGLALIVSLVAISDYAGRRALYFFTDVIGFTGYSVGLYWHNGIFLFCFLFGFIGLAEAIYNSSTSS